MDIIKIIENIPPLPDTVIMINQVANDPESSVKDLAREIKKDPIATANILKEARSPLYGFKNVDTVEKAVAQFGKDTSKGIALAAVAKESLSIDLRPYEIELDDFSKVSQKRAYLMLKWFSRVDFSKLSVLSITSLLGNLGQIVVAQGIINDNRVEEFQAIAKEKGYKEAEIAIVGDTSTHVTAMILKHWKFSDMIVDSIDYSDNYHESDESIQKITLANSIVYSLVDQTNKVAMNIDEKIYELLEEFKMKPEYLKIALESIVD
jgi:HD-like signal output (HDOD) protein